MKRSVKGVLFLCIFLVSFVVCSVGVSAIPYGAEISIKGYENSWQYLSINGDDGSMDEGLNVNRDKVGPWELFKFYREPPVDNPDYEDSFLHYGDTVKLVSLKPEDGTELRIRAIDSLISYHWLNAQEGAVAGNKPVCFKIENLDNPSYTGPVKWGGSFYLRIDPNCGTLNFNDYVGSRGSLGSAPPSYLPLRLVDNADNKMEFKILNSEGEITPTCSDSDGGINYGTKGTVTGECCGATGITDICSDRDGISSLSSGTHLGEYYCNEEKNNFLTELYSCPNGCVDGACVSDGPPPSNLNTCSISPVSKNIKINEIFTFDVVCKEGTTIVECPPKSVSFSNNGIVEIVPSSQPGLPLKGKSEGSTTVTVTPQGGKLYSSCSTDVNGVNVVAGITPDLTVVSPNGGENWNAGSNYAFEWTSSDSFSSDDYVIIELYNFEGELAQTISSPTSLTENDGLTYKTLSSNLPPGNYKVRMSIMGRSDYYDESDDYFTIGDVVSTSCQIVFGKNPIEIDDRINVIAYCHKDLILVDCPELLGNPFEITAGDSYVNSEPYELGGTNSDLKDYYRMPVTGVADGVVSFTANIPSYGSCSSDNLIIGEGGEPCTNNDDCDDNDESTEDICNDIDVCVYRDVIVTGKPYCTMTPENVIVRIGDSVPITLKCYEGETQVNCNDVEPPENAFVVPKDSTSASLPMYDLEASLFTPGGFIKDYYFAQVTGTKKAVTFLSSHAELGSGSCDTDIVVVQPCTNENEAEVCEEGEICGSNGYCVIKCNDKTDCNEISCPDGSLIYEECVSQECVPDFSKCPVIHNPSCKIEKATEGDFYIGDVDNFVVKCYDGDRQVKCGENVGLSSDDDTILNVEEGELSPSPKRDGYISEVEALKSGSTQLISKYWNGPECSLDVSVEKHEVDDIICEIVNLESPDDYSLKVDKEATYQTICKTVLDVKNNGEIKETKDRNCPRALTLPLFIRDYFAFSFNFDILEIKDFGRVKDTDSINEGNAFIKINTLGLSEGVSVLYSGYVYSNDDNSFSCERQIKVLGEGSTGGVCGDGDVDTPNEDGDDEECDDSNTRDGVCSNNPDIDCNMETADADCDDGDDDFCEFDGCSHDCKLMHYCGNGVVESPEEECDGDNLGAFGILLSKISALEDYYICSDECKIVLDEDEGVTCGEGDDDTLSNDDCEEYLLDDDNDALYNCEDAGYGECEEEIKECIDCIPVIDVCDAECDDDDFCGNNEVDEDKGEKCDGNVFLDDWTCKMLDFDRGSLGCEDDCKDFDTSECGTKIGGFESCADIDVDTCNSYDLDKLLASEPEIIDTIEGTSVSGTLPGCPIEVTDFKCGEEIFENEGDECGAFYNCSCGKSGSKCKSNAGWALTLGCSFENGDYSAEFEEVYKKCLGSCQVTVGNVRGNCAEGDDSIDISWTAKWDSDYVNENEADSCKDGSLSFDCPPIAGLPFFALFNLLICVLAIICIYFVWKRK